MLDDEGAGDGGLLSLGGDGDGDGRGSEDLCPGGAIPGCTCKVAAPVTTCSRRWMVPVTVCGPAVVAVQLLALQVPSVMVKAVELVRSPSELP